MQAKAPDSVELPFIEVPAGGTCTLQEGSAFGAVMRTGRRSAAGAAGIEVKFPLAAGTEQQFHCPTLGSHRV
jgi:hypothetical protein